VAAADDGGHSCGHGHGGKQVPHDRGSLKCFGGRHDHVTWPADLEGGKNGERVVRAALAGEGVPVKAVAAGLMALIW
jgi:hypothetical protein